MSTPHTDGGSGSHPHCWTGEAYVHICQQPSGEKCAGCGAPAGTWWGPHWCPACDVRRLDGISEGLKQLKEGISND